MAAAKADIVSPAGGKVASGVLVRCVGAGLGEMYQTVGQQLRACSPGCRSVLVRSVDERNGLLGQEPGSVPSQHRWQRWPVAQGCGNSWYITYR